MTEITEIRVADVAAYSENNRLVLEKYNIDYCCHGNVTLAESCKTKNISVNELMGELNAEQQQHFFSALHYNVWSTEFLVDFIVENHHHFLKENLVPLGKLLEHVTDHHGNKFPILHEVRTVYQRFASTLIAHLFREEEELFPFIKKMYRLAAEKRTMAPPYFGSIEQLEFSLSKEHADTGNELALLRELTNNFTPPAGACNSFKRVYAILEEIYHDTKKHIHLENNLLFPKALEIEKRTIVKTST
ncbi:MAG: DUF542 domain-containing protein [Ignavibacteria bacterium]|nr:DUF542 domain-containing protein [Ignavibacteria bacterium]